MMEVHSHKGRAMKIIKTWIERADIGWWNVTVYSNGIIIRTHHDGPMPS